MNGFNKAVIMGNLTNNPDLRYTVSKRAFARFRVAVSNSYRNSDGEVQTNTEYINVIIWGTQAENCGKYLKKGSPALIEGRIQTSSYEAKDGSGKKYMTEINASNVIFLGSSGQNADMSDNSNQSPQTSSGSDKDAGFGMNIGESGFVKNSEESSEIPF